MATWALVKLSRPSPLVCSVNGITVHLSWEFAWLFALFDNLNLEDYH